MSTRTMAMVFGIAFLVIGAGGFIPGMNHEATPHPDLTMTHGFGHALGLFPANTLHNIVHVLFGLWGVLASRSHDGSRIYFRGVAIIYGLLTVMGLVDGLNTTFGLIPLYGADVALHAVLALGGVYFGWMRRETGRVRS